MVEVLLWVLIWTNSDYSGFVTRVDDFASQEACQVFARDLQKRSYTKGTPHCMQAKVLRAAEKGAR